MNSHLKILFLLTFLSLFLLGPSIPSTGEPLFETTELKKGEAEVRYLFHAGWTIRTVNTIIILDYIGQTQEQNESSFLNGIYNIDRIKDQEIYVFISHGHSDHFDDKVLGWKKLFPDITYIFGWKPENIDNVHYFGQERSVQQIGRLQIKNIYYDFDKIPESAFLIEVDGLTVFFSGDHGGYPGKLNPVYKDNIDYMAKQSQNFDLVFLSIFGAPTYDSELYAIKKYNPRVILPMHYWGQEAQAEEFVSIARKKFKKSQFWYPLKKGDGFLYKNNKIFPFE
jgi:L-ascorbate metabolism protein UlaG (beta-lactamase superfamily)